MEQGLGAGALKEDLCNAVFECYKETRCFQWAAGEVAPGLSRNLKQCICGPSQAEPGQPDFCPVGLNPPFKGSCASPLVEGFPEDDGTYIGLNWTDTTAPGGALNYYMIQAIDYCRTECLPELVETPSDAGADAVGDGADH